MNILPAICAILCKASAENCADDADRIGSSWCLATRPAVSKAGSSSLNSVSTLGGLPLRVKAWCSFQAVSGGSGKFGDSYSTALSSVFEGSLARNGVPGGVSSKGPLLPALFLSDVHFSWQAWPLWDILKSGKSTTK